MASSDYTSIPSTGKLKLKGGPQLSSDSKVSKKKKKHKSKDHEGAPTTVEDAKTKVSRKRDGYGEEEDGQATETVLSKALKDEDQDIAGPGPDDGKDIWRDRGKTEAEKRWEEQRRRRLDDRLKREGIKSHKERVEELNRYLSGLSEHHDMPRIGPG